VPLEGLGVARGGQWRSGVAGIIVEAWVGVRRALAVASAIGARLGRPGGAAFCLGRERVRGRREVTARWRDTVVWGVRSCLGHGWASSRWQGAERRAGGELSFAGVWGSTTGCSGCLMPIGGNQWRAVRERRGGGGHHLGLFLLSPFLLTKARARGWLACWGGVGCWQAREGERFWHLAVVCCSKGI
jgi:hypothetical protein